MLQADRERFSDLKPVYALDAVTDDAGTLELLWALLRHRKESVGMPYLASALDQIKAADPSLELDRRFQWLETISVRFA